MDLNKEKQIYLMGIKGVAMSGLAIVLKQMGFSVLGSDVEEYFQTQDILKKNGISILKGFNKTNISREYGLMVITGAHNGFENIEAQTARELGIPVLTHAEFIGQLINEFKNRIVICGSHGKTTITSMVSASFKNAGYNPTFLVGTSDFSGIDNASYGEKDYFIIEGDEYGNAPPKDKKPRFAFYNSNYVVCPNIDFDHPDIYKNLDEIKKEFLNYFNKDDKIIIACGDDANFLSLKSQILNNKVFTYGYNKNNDLVINDLSTANDTKFELVFQGKKLGQFELSVFGSQNILNATSVILLSLKLGLDLEKIKTGLKVFTGARRRFEKLFTNEKWELYDDYAHHPKEVLETLKAVKKHFENKKILVIFQPHTYSRTFTLLNDFVESLKLADLCLVTDIFASAREKKEDFPITSLSLQENAIEQNISSIIYVPLSNLISKINELKNSFNIIITMGAGDLYKYHKQIVNILES